MMVPRWKEEYQDKSIKELMKEQQKVMNQIMDFEDQYVLKTKPIKNPEAMNCDPMPDVRWRVWSMDLVMLTQLIDEKTRDESGCGFFPS